MNRTFVAATLAATVLATSVSLGYADDKVTLTYLTSQGWVLDAHSAPAITGPAAIDGIGPTDDWQGYWQKTDLRKRKAASWANGG